MREPLTRDDKGAARRSMPPTLVISRNPLVPAQPMPARAFVPVGSLAPSDVRGALMLRFNGAWLLRRDWGRIVVPGDVVEWVEVPQGGGGGSRTVLTLVILAAAILGGPMAGAFLNSSLSLGLTTASQIAALGTAAISIAGNLLVNALVPIPEANVDLGGGVASPASVYNVSAAGNQARLYQPIPVIYGRHPVFPDFASQPYVEYHDNDQYYYCLLCVGQGEYAIDDRDILIDDTPIGHFSDVTFRVHGPGWSPPVPSFEGGLLFNRSGRRLVHPAVVTSAEVAGQAIKPGIYTGGFSASGPGKLARSVAVDVLFDRLGRANDDGSVAPYSVTVRAEYRVIDDYGVPVSAWSTLIEQTITAASTAPVRRTLFAGLAADGRVEVRMVRVDVRDESTRVFNDPVWGGMRAYLAEPATLSATATHIEIAMRASEQLSGLSQRRFKVIPRRKLVTWAPGTGYTAPVETRNPAWAQLDIWRNPVYGDALPDSRIDLQTLYTLAQVWDARQDRCDIVFDSRTTSWEAARLVARTGRAVPFRRMGVNTLTRDQRQTLPVTAYTTRNMLPGASIGYVLPTEETPDGVIAEYFDGRAGEWREVRCPAPGVTVPSRPVRVRYMGITGRTHAQREGLYEAAQALWRRKFPRWPTELEGMLPSYGALVVCAPPMTTLLQAGDVLGWDETARVLTVTEPPTFAAGQSYAIALHRDDGSITPPIGVSPGPVANTVVLATAPDFAPTFDDPHRERTKYFFAAVSAHRTLTRVLGIRRQGRNAEGIETIELSGVVEDDRIHDVDAHLLPGPGVVQDPIASSNTAATGGAAGERLLIVELTDHDLSTPAPSSSGSMHVSFTLLNDGRAATWPEWLAGDGGYIAGQWVRHAPIETSTAGAYDVMATVLPGGSIVIGNEATPPEPYGDAPSGSPVGEWLPLDTSRTWTYSVSFANLSVRVRFDIRHRDSGVVQASGIMLFAPSGIAPPTDGG